VIDLKMHGENMKVLFYCLGLQILCFEPKTRVHDKRKIFTVISVEYVIKKSSKFYGFVIVHFQNTQGEEFSPDYCRNGLPRKSIYELKLAFGPPQNQILCREILRNHFSIL